MKHDRSHRRFVIPVAIASLLALGLFASVSPVPPQTFATTPLIVYFDDGPFLTTGAIRDDALFVELTGLIRRMALPYTDATAAGTFTIRGPSGTLITTTEEDTLTIGGRTLQLERPPFRDDGRWYVPVEFLTSGLAEITAVDFRYASGTSRIFAGTLRAPPLAISAVGNQGETRLTLRSGVSINVRVQQIPEENRVILAIDHAPFNPNTETLDYRDGSIRSVQFDDADGRSKILVETTPQVASVRLTPTEGNRTFYVDFVPESAPAEPVDPVPAPDPESLTQAGGLRVIVIDPGHGGLDSGTQTSGTLEKDLTLALARRVRAGLQTRFDTTVILTRDSDIELSGEARSAIANNNAADLLISLHIGYSLDPTETGASLFVMKETFSSGIGGSDDGRDTDDALFEETLFKPWYSAYELNLSGSRALGEILRRRLAATSPGWPFLLREAPLSILTSAAMPAVLIELGNANNPANLQALSNAAFQDRLIDAIVGSVTEFGASQGGGA